VRRDGDGAEDIEPSVATLPDAPAQRSQEDALNLPGLTAEASLYETSRHYRTSKHPITSPTRIVNRIYPAMKEGETHIRSQLPASLPMLAGGGLGGAGVAVVPALGCQVIEDCQPEHCIPGSNVCWRICTHGTICW
jgi:hypothetical protein